MRTRIKVVTDGNGWTKYFPQYRRWFLWHNYIKFFYYTCQDIWFGSLEGAESFLEEKVKLENERRIASVTYKKFP